ncbi:MAG: acetylxylan esterase [Anaerolineae bacterium]|nr:acetylxylan esterase [Anaerolineae bacterium]
MAQQHVAMQAHVDALYAQQPRQLALRASSLAEFLAWQRVLRQEVFKLLGLAGRTLPASVTADRLQVVDRGEYFEEKYALGVGEGVAAPLYILVPKTPPPYKPILVFHGHNPSVQYILGNYPDPETAAQMRAVDNNYAQVLAQAGYLVCAVEQRGFGERISDQVVDKGSFTSSCGHLAFEYLMQGRTLLGERCWDGMCALTYLQSRADVVPGAVGCTGNSGGGTTTLWLAALDERITVVVPSCYFCSFKASILGMAHCACNYVPGILPLAEMGDLAALIAPRPFRAIAGEHDPLFPVAATREQFETVQRAYALFDAGDRCSLAVHGGAHAYQHGFSQAWFAEWL